MEDDDSINKDEIELEEISYINDSSIHSSTHAALSVDDHDDGDDGTATIVVDEESESMKKASLKKLVTSMLTVLVLIFAGAAALYGIEGKHELKETGKVVDWKYLNCVYFCVVTLTTIGYGDLTPKTPGGKVFVVMYAIISLGVMAAAITTIGQVIVLQANQKRQEFMKVSKNVTKRLQKIAKLQTEPTEKDLHDAMKEEIQAEQKETMKRFVIRLIGLLTLIAIAIFAGARVFVALEDWQYGDAVYYCFITLLTIGYGDFYPHTDGGKIFFIFYAFIGLGILAFIIGDIGEKIMSRTQAQLQEIKLQKALKSKIAKFQKFAKIPKPNLKILYNKKRADSKDCSDPKQQDGASTPEQAPNT